MGVSHKWEITSKPLPTREMEEFPSNTQNYTHIKDVLSQNLPLVFPPFTLKNGRTHSADILEY